MPKRSLKTPRQRYQKKSDVIRTVPLELEYRGSIEKIGKAILSTETVLCNSPGMDANGKRCKSGFWSDRVLGFAFKDMYGTHRVLSLDQFYDSPELPIEFTRIVLNYGLTLNDAPVRTLKIIVKCNDNWMALAYGLVRM